MSEESDKIINGVEQETNPVNRAASAPDLSKEDRKAQTEQNAKLGVRPDAPEAIVPNTTDPQHPEQDVAIPAADPKDVAENGVLEAESPKASELDETKKA